MKQLSEIAQKPHAMGSDEHKSVRDYIVNQLESIGLKPEIETALVCWKWWGIYRAGTAQNVVARLKGRDNSKAILLVGHYDSVPASPGATDNGSTVVSILETLRLLKSGEPLRNDVIALFTDGEEIGVFGAEAFVDEHPWARDVGLVIHADNSGNGGPLLLIETSDQNGWIVREYGKVASRTFSSSLIGELYRKYFEPTGVGDFTILRRSGFDGFNFGSSRNQVYYHTERDNIETIDRGFLQNLGDNILGLTRHFGNLDLQRIRKSNLIYFDILGSTLITYDERFSLPLMFITLLSFALVIFLGFRSGRLTFSRLFLGATAFFTSLLIAPFATGLCWYFIKLIHRDYDLFPQGDVYNSNLYFIGLLLLTVAICSYIYHLWGKKVGIDSLFIGGLLWWLIPLVGSSLFWPGGSYLSALPLLAISVTTGFLFMQKESESIGLKRFFILTIGVTPGVVLVLPVLMVAFDAFTIKSIGELMVVFIFLIGLLLPHLKLIENVDSRLLPLSSVILGLLFITAATITSRTDNNHPKPGKTVFYALDGDRNEAIWGAESDQLDEWSSQFVASNHSRGLLNNIFPLNRSAQYPNSPAPIGEVPPPEINLLEDRSSGGERALTLRISSPRRAEIISIYLLSKNEVLGASLNGKDLLKSMLFRKGAEGHVDTWTLTLNAPPKEGVELILTIKPAQPLSIMAVDRSYGLPNLPNRSPRSRPLYIMETPSYAGMFYPNCDSTLVSKTYNF